MGADRLPWREVARRLATSRNYWLGTTAVDGSPRASPVWGAVVGDDLYVYSERSTLKARNLARDDRVVLHLESGNDVLIVHGTLADLGRPAEHPDVLAAFAAKYTEPGDAAVLPDADPAFDVLYLLRPISALAWLLADYDDSQRRYP